MTTTSEINNKTFIDNNKDTKYKERYQISVRTKEMFKELEQKYRIKNGTVSKGKRPSDRREYRQTIEMIYDALKSCRTPQVRSNVINSSYSSPKTQRLIKQMIIHELIMPGEKTSTWVITERGWNLLHQINKLANEFPFLLNKITDSEKDLLDYH